MADNKISELDPITGANVADDDLFVIADTSETDNKSITALELKTVINAPGIRDTSRDLIVQYISNSTLDIDASEIILTDTNNVAIKNIGTNLTANIATAGANGLDTGSESSSTWYYIYVIYNPTTTTEASLLSESSTNPTMPSGYTYKSNAGAVYNNGEGNFTSFRQDCNYVNNGLVGVLSAGTAGSYTLVSLLVAAPVNAIKVSGYVHLIEGSGTNCNMRMRPTAASDRGQQEHGIVGVSGTIQKYDRFELKLEETQALYYILNSGDNTSITVTSYTI